MGRTEVELELREASCTSGGTGWGARLLTALEANRLHHAPDARHRDAGFGVSLAGFGLRSNIPCCTPILPFWNRNVYSVATSCWKYIT